MEALINKIGKELNLSVMERNDLCHDLNNLRGEEWLDWIEEDCTKETVKEFKKLLGYESYKGKPFIKITPATEKPNEKTWSYPVTEIDYILNQIKDGDRENGELFYLYNGRLYESSETEEC